MGVLYPIPEYNEAIKEPYLNLKTYALDKNTFHTGEREIKYPYAYVSTELNKIPLGEYEEDAETALSKSDTIYRSMCLSELTCKLRKSNRQHQQYSNDPDCKLIDQTRTLPTAKYILEDCYENNGTSQ